VTVYPPSHHSKTGLARQAWLVLLAASLLAGGIVVALQALSYDAEMHRRYGYALTLSKAALEAQNASADLRSWQARNARELLRGDTVMPKSEFTELARLASDLRERLARLAELEMPADHQGTLLRLQETLQESERAARQATVEASDVTRTRATVLASHGDFDALEHALTALVGEANARATAAARQAESLDATARITLGVLSGVALVLAIVLIALTVRTLRANNSLLDRMSHLAQEDALTGIANRRTLDEALPVEFARARRGAVPLTLVMLDLDHFKRYNDRRGHAAGDALLRGAAQAWLKQLRPTDLLARYGGEEFTLVLPACDADQAAQLVDRMRPLMPDRQTFSAGIATWDADETAIELVQRADRALSLAKKRGRNRTMIAGRELQTTLPLEIAASS
jgi:diguanylate cyclase (GGDEF)-like protein